MTIRGDEVEVKTIPATRTNVPCWIAGTQCLVPRKEGPAICRTTMVTMEAIVVATMTTETIGDPERDPTVTMTTGDPEMDPTVTTDTIITKGDPDRVHEVDDPAQKDTFRRMEVITVVVAITAVQGLLLTRTVLLLTGICKERASSENSVGISSPRPTRFVDTALRATTPTFSLLWGTWH